MWTGEQSVDLGLVDALGNTRYVAEEIIGEKNLLDYTKRTRLLDRLFDGMESSLGAVVLKTLGLDGAVQWR